MAQLRARFAPPLPLPILLEGLPRDPDQPLNLRLRNIERRIVKVFLEPPRKFLPRQPRRSLPRPHLRLPNPEHLSSKLPANVSPGKHPSVSFRHGFSRSCPVAVCRNVI